MRIAQVAPLFESVPPKLYGGTERVVSYLTEELVRLGHDVTLFASGDSNTSARLVPHRSTAIRLDNNCMDVMASHVLMVEDVARRSSQFDIVHWHIDHLHFPLCRRVSMPSVTTLHNRLDIPELAPLFAEYRDMPVVSISDSHRRPLPDAHWAGTVYHGLPSDRFRYSPASKGYLAVLGRVSPEKGVDRAIRIALRTGRRVKIAAKVDRKDVDHFERDVRPLLNEPGVEFLGEIGEGDKSDFLGGADALLFPIDWPEPFGLVMVEAMACGTPVIAYRRGSVPEIVQNGVTGFIVESEDEAVAALRRLPDISRRRCRAEFEKRFSANRMARNYLAIYQRLTAAHREAPAAILDIPMVLTGLERRSASFPVPPLPRNPTPAKPAN